MSDDRAAALTAWLGIQRPASLVDLGCGRGGFLRVVHSVLPEVRLIGVDLDEPSIEDARRLSEAVGGMEWDALEHGWIAGVRNLGAAEAEAFAVARSADDPRYRGVLGFGWLQLTRG